MAINLATESDSGYTFIFDTDTSVLTIHNNLEAHTFAIPESSHVDRERYTTKVLGLREAKDFIEGEFSRAFGLSRSSYSIVNHKVKLIKALLDAV